MPCVSPRAAGPPGARDMRDLPTSLMQAVRAGLSKHTGRDARARPLAAFAGGQINRGMVVQHGDDRWFLKLHRRDRLPMFEAELQGLLELSAARCLAVPRPLFCGAVGEHAYLVMEYLELVGRGDSAALGAGLAAMHAVRSTRFGWKMDNTIGLTPQVNTPADDWVAFWRERRLAFQFRLAADRGHAASLRRSGDRLLARMHHLFDGYSPAPSLLHGDLWCGNYGFLPGGEPVVYDPAVYFGDRETDLAMTELFGGFDPDFHAAYRAAWAPDPGYATRKHLYQLYHVLNHLNLFGPAYLAQAEALTGRLLAELD